MRGSVSTWIIVIHKQDKLHIMQAMGLKQLPVFEKKRGRAKHQLQLLFQEHWILHAVSYSTVLETGQDIPQPIFCTAPEYIFKLLKNHRMTWVPRDVKRSSSSNPLPLAGLPSTASDCPQLMKPELQHLHRREVRGGGRGGGRKGRRKKRVPLSKLLSAESMTSFFSCLVGTS